MNDIMIQFQGFHPSEFTRSYIDSILTELQTHAPAGARIRAVFTRKNKILRANVRLMSAAGHFFASAQGFHLRDVSHKISQRIDRRLKKWKSRRRHRMGEKYDSSSVA